MQKLNVLFISSWYPSREHPTLGNFIQKHAEAVNPFVNLEVLNVTSSAHCESIYEIDYNEEKGVSTTIVYYKKVKSKLPFVSSFLKYLRTKKAYLKGYNFIKQTKKIQHFDITHCNVTYPGGYFALYLKKKEGIPYVVSEHWTAFLPYRNEFKSFNFLQKKVIKDVVKNANLMLPVSEHLAKSMDKLGLKQKFIVVPNVVETNIFDLKSKVKVEVVDILHVSTVDDNQKNILGIFRALKEVSNLRQDFRLTIVSDGDIEAAKELLNQSGLDANFVVFEGTKTTEEIVKYYQAADFFLLFSNYENLPCVVVESMSCGLPIVSSAIAGIPEHINETNGILVEAKNESQLKDAILNMLDSYNTYDRERIREYAIKHFDYSSVGKQFLEVYKEVLS